MAYRMDAAVFSIVMVAAALHATWNAIVKAGHDSALTTAMVTGSAALIATMMLPFVPAPARASWPFLAASAILSVGYYALVARTYRVADMSRTYPLMRGTAPLLIAIASTAFLGDRLTVTAWCGVAVICAGIFCMIGGRRPGQGRGSGLAMLNAVVIAGYTLIDGAGVRRSGSPAGYTLWIFLLTGIPLLVWAIVGRGAAFRAYLGQHWRLGLVGGAGTTASYGLALWAMTAASVVVVAALRETSILFGTALSAIVLKEHVDRSRLAATCAIAVGAAILRSA